ncbi:hypothetical protein RABR111495_08155 [Rahnella bruchi]
MSAVMFCTNPVRFLQTVNTTKTVINGQRKARGIVTVCKSVAVLLQRK